MRVRSLASKDRLGNALTGVKGQKRPCSSSYYWPVSGLLQAIYPYPPQDIHYCIIKYSIGSPSYVIGRFPMTLIARTPLAPWLTPTEHMAQMQSDSRSDSFDSSTVRLSIV